MIKIEFYFTSAVYRVIHFISHVDLMSPSPTFCAPMKYLAVWELSLSEFIKQGHFNLLCCPLIGDFIVNLCLMIYKQEMHFQKLSWKPQIAKVLFQSRSAVQI